VQNDFCNSIGTSRHFAKPQNLVAVGPTADIRPERFLVPNGLVANDIVGGFLG